tara:strand:- start:7948 stop:8232 length:285 start_codon:yes stop_codon:yes gene_type:complete
MRSYRSQLGHFITKNFFDLCICSGTQIPILRRVYLDSIKQRRCVRSNKICKVATAVLEIPKPRHRAHQTVDELRINTKIIAIDYKIILILMPVE